MILFLNNFNRVYGMSGGAKEGKKEGEKEGREHNVGCERQQQVTCSHNWDLRQVGGRDWCMVTLVQNNCWGQNNCLKYLFWCSLSVPWYRQVTKHGACGISYSVQLSVNVCTCVCTYMYFMYMKLPVKSAKSVGHHTLCKGFKIKL